MRTKKQEPLDLTGVRLVNGRDGARVCGMGLNTFRKWADQIGASRKIGYLRRYDLDVIYKHLDNLNA